MTELSDRSVSGNRLLAALPKKVRDRVFALLEPIDVHLRDALQKPGEPVRYVHFPTGGFCSIVSVLRDGSMVEVATVGREGMLDVAGAMTDAPATSLTMVQGEGPPWYRMTKTNFRREMDRREEFHQLARRFEHALLGFAMQSTACNAVHSVEQRLARWLLLAQDRMGRGDFPLTQEFVAMMLGASRPTVTIVAGTLQKAGLITYHRGQVVIVDREKLREVSCECYEFVTNLFAAIGSKPNASVGKGGLRQLINAEMTPWAGKSDRGAASATKRAVQGVRATYHHAPQPSDKKRARKSKQAG